MEGLDNAANLISATLRLATPLLLAAMGGLLSYQVGLVNISLEGLMLIGAFVSVAASAWLGSTVGGVVVAALVAAVVSTVFALFVTRLRANLIIAGLAVNFLAVGATAYLIKVLFASTGTYAPIGLDSLPMLSIANISDGTLWGRALLSFSPLVYVSWAVVPLIAVFLYRTVTGLQIRAVGENTSAARTAGVPVGARQYLALILCGVLCGVAGAHLAVGDLTLFRENMTAGRGFIALAAVYFAAGRPGLTTLACLLFGFFEAVQFRLQLTSSIPSQFFQMLPYLMVVLMLVAISIRKEWHKGWS